MMQECIISMGRVRNSLKTIYLSMLCSNEIFVPPKIAMLQYFKFVLLVLARQLIPENVIFMNIGKTSFRQTLL